jgi:heat shock protein HslJ
MTAPHRVAFVLLLAIVAGGCTSSGDETRDVPALEGSSWRLAGDAGPAAPTLAFTGEGELRGSAGCNAYFGSYELAGTRLEVGELATTKKLCQPAELMEREAAYLASLRQAAEVRLEDGELVLESATGEELLRLVRSGE